VDDEADLLENCRRILIRAGYGCLTAEDGQQGLNVFKAEMPDLVLVDVRMPGMSGVELLRHIRKLCSQTPVVLITAYASTQTAMEAMEVGAFDYLPKPFDAERLLDVVSKALEFSGRRAPEASSRAPLFDRCGMVGESPQVRSVLDVVRRVALSEANTVIFGETGSGKELVARMVHRNSPRSAGPFVALDCASLSESLLEAELFGHERGAYTDAKEGRPGMLETANGGVVFLDEVAELSPLTQAKLLRTLEQKEVRRVGGRRQIPINLRVSAATNKCLPDLVRNGQFREDLYYRLNVVSIQVPPLRERGGDIRLLAEHFFKTFRQCQPCGTVCGVSEAAFMILEHYSWPGNVRELRNAIERAVSLSQGFFLSPLDLPEELLASAAEARSPLGEFQSRKRGLIQDFERRYLRDLMERVGGNVTQAAEVAGMLRPALQRLLRKHAVDPVDYR
jgi:DNA-binding NtrC family response regulator